MAYYPFATEVGATYRLVNSDGATAVFNDPTDPNYVGVLGDVTGLDSADVRESASDLTQSDGGVHGDFYLGRRPITLSGRVFGHGSILERNLRLDRARRASNALRGDAVLSWKPSTRVENLITNPRAQSNTNDWVTNVTGVINSGATLTQATGVAPAVGTTALQVATSGAGSATQGAAIPFTVKAGQTYAVTVQARRTAGTDTYNIQLAGVASGTVVGGASAAAFTTYTLTFTPASSGTAYLRISGSSTNTLASTFQITDVSVAPGTDTTYRDGDTAGWYWQGNQGNSASGDFIEMQTWVRRQQPFRETGAWAKDFQIALVSQYAPLFSAQQLVSAATANGTAVAAENRGSVPSYPILRITAPGAGTLANPTVTNSVTGTVFRTTGLTLAAGETVEFDMLSHTGKFTAGARNNQAANRFIDFATTGWPCLNSGTQNFTLAGTSGGTLTVLWRDAWG